MDMFDLASTLFGGRGNPVAQGSTLTATGSAASAGGTAYLTMDADVTPAEGVGDDTDQTVIDVPTSPSVAEGDEVIMTLVGDGPLKTPVVMANPGFGDRIQTQVDSAETLAQQAEAVAQEAAEDVEQVRQDVADFRDDVATTYATKVEREDGDDAVKTWVTTNYTNSNDLATTYATKTLVSQTKDAIELAASQTYETQTDAAATYATKSALTVGLDGIRSEVAEDYQPKGDYATTASMNSAIQQSASSIESSVAATYETKSDAAATYATKTEVQQTASGLDTRITTAQSTADGAYLERTASGTTIDTTGGATIRSLVVEGQSVQDGTPTPSAPIPIKSVEGANLYDPTKAVSGYLTTSGTITGATSNNEMTSDFILIGGGNVVTVLYEVDNRAVHQPWVCVQWFKADKTFGGQLVRGTIPWDRQWMRFIIPTDGVYVRVAARHLSSGYGALAVKLGYSSFYLSDYGSIGIVSSNANVADPSNVFDSYFISTDPYSYGLQSTTALEQTMGFIPLEGAERIGFSVDGCASDMTQDTTGGFVRILFMDDNGDRVALEETIARSHFTYTASTITMNNPIAVPAGATMATICFRTYGGTPCIRLDGSNEFVEYQGTRTDIDLQGHALRSLPDGTRDEMAVDSLGRVTMTQRVGVTNTATTDGITATVGVDAMSTTGDLSDGATVLYPLATPQTIDLGTIDLPAPADTLWLDAALVPTMGATWWTVDGIAGQQALDAEVTERQTLIRQFSGGVLAGYVGNAIAALVNAAGSFDVVRTAWSGGVPSILGTLARYAASGISLFDAAGNVLAEFASDHVRIGGDVPIGDATTGGAAVQFFDQTDTHGSGIEAAMSLDEASDYYDMRSNVVVSSQLADEERATDTGSTGNASISLEQWMGYGMTGTGEQFTETHSALVADSTYDGDGQSPVTSHARVSATATTGNIYANGTSYVELIADALGIGENEGAIDYYRAAVVKSAIVPVTLFTGTYAQTHNSSVTLSETAANFSRLMFVCENNDGELTSVTVTDPNGKNFNVVMVTIAGPTGTGTYVYMKAKSFSINGTSVTCRTYTYNGQTIYRHGSVTLRNGVAVAATQASEEIGIVKVLGWR